MRYSLSRTRDGAGDSGPMSLAIDYVDGKYVEDGNRPKIGYAMRVGSYRAGTYSTQDYWTTTRVTEILEERDDYVRFKTGNSEYEWGTF